MDKGAFGSTRNPRRHDRSAPISVDDEQASRARFDSSAIPVILNLTNRPHYASTRCLGFQDFPY